MKKIYIAGPLFTEGERVLLEKIDSLCQKMGFDTYLPHRDAGLFTREEEGSKKFFLNDHAKIKQSDFIVAILNGLDVDSGTSWELGFGFANKKPIIGYVNDTRIYEPNNQFNPMVFNSIQIITKNLDELKKTLKGFQ